MREHFFDFFERLVAGFWVCEVELDGARNAHDAKDDENSPVDVLESGWNIKAEVEVEEQLPRAAIPIPVARVSKLQTSAAYTHATGARVMA